MKSVFGGVKIDDQRALNQKPPGKFPEDNSLAYNNVYWAHNLGIRNSITFFQPFWNF